MPTGSPAVYAVEFERNATVGCVTVLWTLRGSRHGRRCGVQGLHRDRDRPDGQRDADASSADGRASAARLSADAGLPRHAARAITPESRRGAATHGGSPRKANAFLVSALGKLADWQVETGRNTRVGVLQLRVPAAQGRLRVRRSRRSSRARTTCCGSQPRLPVAGSPLSADVLACSRTATASRLPGEPTEIGLMVNGNGGWGRIIFELEDAGGQRWISHRRADDAASRRAGWPTG